MSLYALLPSPSTPTAVGSDLVQTLTKQHQSFAEEERKAKMAATEKHIIIDMSKVNLDGMMDETISLSSISHDGLEETDSSSLASLSKRERHEWSVSVEEAMINYKNLVRPPRNSGRASVSRRSRDSRLCRRRGTSAKASLFDLDPTESALEFRLVISYAGRTYCTKRTLLQIAQCRQNLVEEQEWTHRKLDCSSTSEELLPELPRVAESLFCGGGFAQMNGMMDAYKPTLEKWFQEVIAIVSDENAILSDFLWEPLDCTCNRDSLHASLTNLGIINESVVHTLAE